MAAAVGPSRSLALSLGIGAGGVAYAARVGWRELTALNKVEQLTKAHLESTGRAANVSARHIRKRSIDLESATSIDENLIGSGQNLLLTFRNIRNEAGKGNKIFDRTTMAALNLSQEFGSVGSASKMLGKALNDPVLGMTAMSRAGVTFSQSQKDAVARMVESNDMLGAQKLILREVEAQVGGTAKAYGDSVEGMGNRITDAFGDLSRGLVTGLLPIVERYATPFTNWLGNVSDIVDRRGWRAAWEEVVPEELQDNVGSIAGAISGGLVPAVAAFTIKIGLASLKLAPFLLMGSALADMLGVQVEKSDQLGESMKNKLGPGLGTSLEKLSALTREVNQWGPGGKTAAGLGLLMAPTLVRGGISSFRRPGAGYAAPLLATGAMAGGAQPGVPQTRFSRAARAGGRGFIATAALAPFMPMVGEWLGNKSFLGNGGGQRAEDAIDENRLTNLLAGQKIAGQILRGNTEALEQYKSKMLQLANAEDDEARRQLLLDKRLQISKYALNLVTNELSGQSDRYSHLTSRISDHSKAMALASIEAGDYRGMFDRFNGTLREHVRWLDNALGSTEALAEAQADLDQRRTGGASRPSGGGGGGRKGGRGSSGGGSSEPTDAPPPAVRRRGDLHVTLELDRRAVATKTLEGLGDLEEWGS
jgi:hypothetical protein